MMGIWSQVSNMAAQTPEDRNRYVDFLRAISILVVITGHWLIATAWYVDGGLSQGHLLKEQPQTQWLTWLFQVMPIFFIVGGYSNAVSLESAKRKGTGYGGWLAARLNRLVAPLLILIVAWAVIAVVMRLMGVTSPVVQFASQAALIPTWFLAIYIMIVILAPHAYRFWRRFGFLSFWVFAAAAATCDALFFMADIKWPGWTNYFWVWLAVHHLGFAWRDDRLGSVRTLLIYSAIGFAVLYLLIMKGPYPLAMVGSPDEGLSNTLPPKITLLALGVFQFGILLSLERPMRRLLDNARLWTATVLVNSMIMTVYLWHITVMVVIVSVMFLLDGFGLRTQPGSDRVVDVASGLDPDARRGAGAGGVATVDLRAARTKNGFGNTASLAADRWRDAAVHRHFAVGDVRLRRRAIAQVHGGLDRPRRWFVPARDHRCRNQRPVAAIQGCEVIRIGCSSL